jgi:hypothetical protein
MYEEPSPAACRAPACEPTLRRASRPSAEDYGRAVADGFDSMRELGAAVSNRHRRGDETHPPAEK